MSAQGLIVFALVLGCALHALWRLMPAALRRKIGGREAPGGCSSGCGGCGGTATSAATGADAVKPLRFHPRPPH